MTLPCRLLDSARMDILAAARWYAAQDPSLVPGLVSQIRAALERVSHHPDSYETLIDDLRRAPLHQYPYSLLYRVIPGSVQVVAFRHHRQSLEPYQQ